MGKAFVYITLWYTKTTPGVFLCGGAHGANSLPIAPNEVVNKQQYNAYL